MNFVKKFLFLVIFITPTLAYSMFSLFTLENVMLVLNNKNTFKNALKDIFDTSKNTVNKGLYALSIGLTGLGAWGMTTVFKRAYQERAEEQTFISSLKENISRHDQDRNLTKISIPSLVIGLGILGMLRKNQQK